MVEKLKQTNPWNTFGNWYFEKSVNEIGVWSKIDNLEIYNTIFVNLVFVKFLEEHFEALLYINIVDVEQIYSLFVPETVGYIAFKDKYEFETIEELILAAFEDE